MFKKVTDNPKTFGEVRNSFEQAWVWSPSCDDWIFVPDTDKTFDGIDHLPAVGVHKPARLTSAA
jgi:hypothetical protein